MSIQGSDNNKVASRHVEASSSNHEPSLTDLVPAKLSKPVTVAHFENGIERFKHHYPVHGSVAQIAEGLQEGLDLAYEPKGPLTNASRALLSALAQISKNAG